MRMDAIDSVVEVHLSEAGGASRKYILGERSGRIETQERANGAEPQQRLVLPPTRAAGVAVIVSPSEVGESRRRLPWVGRGRRKDPPRQGDQADARSYRRQKVRDCRKPVARVNELVDVDDQNPICDKAVQVPCIVPILLALLWCGKDAHVQRGMLLREIARERHAIVSRLLIKKHKLLRALCCVVPKPFGDQHGFIPEDCEDAEGRKRLRCSIQTRSAAAHEWHAHVASTGHWPRSWGCVHCNPFAVCMLVCVTVAPLCDKHLPSLRCTGSPFLLSLYFAAVEFKGKFPLPVYRCHHR